MNEPTTLWEILVPKENVVPIDHHHAWDDYVESITGGLTVMKSSRGYWRDKDGSRIKEEMIPVRIACSAAQIEDIAKFTKTHYKQKQVMYYRLSDEVHFV